MQHDKKNDTYLSPAKSSETQKDYFVNTMNKKSRDSSYACLRSRIRGNRHLSVTGPLIRTNKKQKTKNQ
jgi:hypothetical protein